MKLLAALLLLAACAPSAHQFARYKDGYRTACYGQPWTGPELQGDDLLWFERGAEAGAQCGR